MKATLKDILSSVLCDIVLAQHRANLYSQSIGTPQFRFSDIELELRFVTDGTEPAITEMEIADLDECPYPSLLIDINAETMASLPPECVQTLKIKVSPRMTENEKDK